MKRVVVEKIYKHVVDVQCDSDEKALKMAVARGLSDSKKEVLVSIKAGWRERRRLDSAFGGWRGGMSQHREQ